MAVIDRERWRELEPLLDRALELPDEERAAWLGALRSQSPELAAELASLLSGETVADRRGFLAEPLAADPAAPTLAGLELGAYTLERPLGHGGMGTVWLARRSDGRFEAKAAVKLLNLALLSPAGRERFRREGSVLARLTHPGIARLLDAGVSPAGQPYLVLEYIEGRRIDEYCDEERLSPERRVALFLQVLAAVSHAHANLIVHRDLKPSNIFVTAVGTPKLLDFGLAKLLAAETAAGERSELSDLGGLALTPAYAAPEQVTGAPVTTATDVYALGVLLYVLLAGQHPTGPECHTPAEHFRAILDTEPARLSAAVVTASGSLSADELVRAAAARATVPDRLRRLYHGDLDNIIAKALKKKSEERYATVGAFADDLRRYLAHEPVRARRDTVGYRARKFVRRNRASVAAGGLVAAALVAATLVTSTEMVEARRQRDQARAQRDRAVFQEQRAMASSGLMETLLESVAPSGRSYTSLELLGRARDLLERDYRGDPRFVARMMIDLSEHYAAIGRSGEQAALLDSAAALAGRTGDDETSAQAECDIAHYWASQIAETGKPTDPAVAPAKRHLDRALQSLARVREHATQARTECLIAQSKLTALDGGSPDSALALARQAVARAERAGDTASMVYVEALAAVVEPLLMQQKWRDGLRAQQRVIATLERTGRGSTLRAFDKRLDEVHLLNWLGEVRSADSALTDLIRLARRIDPRYVSAGMSLQMGRVAMGLDRPDSAVAVFERQFTEAKRAGDTETAKFALETLIDALLRKGDVARARARLAERTAMNPYFFPGQRAKFEGEFAEARGDSAAAFKWFMASVAERGYPGNPDPTWYGVYTFAARAALASGDAIMADSLARLAIRLERGFGQDETRSGPMGGSLLLAGRARLARGDSLGARETLRRAIPPLEYGFGPDHRLTRQARQLLAALEPGRPR